MTSGDLATGVAALGAALTALRPALAPEAVWHASDEQVLYACRELSAHRARTEAAFLALVAEVDRRRAASGSSTGTRDGTSLGSTTEGLLRTSALVSAGQARRDVAAAHALHGCTTDRGVVVAPTLPTLADQLADGTITREHVDVAVRCLDRIPRHLLAAENAVEDGAEPGADGPAGVAAATTVRDVAVAFVSEVAGSGTARDLDRGCRVILDRLDPDGSTRFDPAADQRRFLDMSTDSTGMLLGRFQLDAAAGLALRAAIDAHSAPSPEEDGLRDARSARQRRADALVRIAEAARSVAAPVRGEPPRVVVVVTPEQLAGDGEAAEAGGAVSGVGAVGGGGGVGGGGAGWSEGGGRVGRATLRRLACDAVLHRVVQGPSAGPLDVGREVRLATRTQRRALAVRDRGCVVPGCGAPPPACDAHHVRHWADGGPTDLGNLVLLCGSHHTAVHSGTWTVRMAADGVPEVIPPRWVDPSRRPRRLWHHLVDAAAARASEGTRSGGADDLPPCATPPADDAPLPEPVLHGPPTGVVVSLYRRTRSCRHEEGAADAPSEDHHDVGPLEDHLRAYLDTG